MIFRFLLVWVKLIFQKLSYESFHNMLYLPLLPVSFMKNFAQLICIVISLEVLEDGSIFSSIARCQKRSSFACKRRRTEAAKTKVYIFVYEIFTNKFFKSYTVIVMWSHALAKWRHCKLKPFQLALLFLTFNFLVTNVIITAFSICTGNVVLCHCTDLASSVGT